jgi:hypothetical protein
MTARLEYEMAVVSADCELNDHSACNIGECVCRCHSTPEDEASPLVTAELKAEGWYVCRGYLMPPQLDSDVDDEPEDDE